MITPLKSKGFVPSDILIRTAIVKGLDELRQKPYLLDFLFSWFAQDDLTKEIYGDAERQRAKDWFLNHEIYVTMNYRMDDPKFPQISIKLNDSVEDLSTLGDVNYETSEDLSSTQLGYESPKLLGPFSPNYDRNTGIVTIPTGFSTSKIYTGNLLVDHENNVGYPILEILSDTTFLIAEGVNPNFTNSYVNPVEAYYKVALESLLFKQSFEIRCFAQSEPIQALYLQAITEFILLRNKQELLEKRGFDNAKISTGGMGILEETDKELVWFRNMNLTGFVRQYWPKAIEPIIQGIEIYGLQIASPTASPDSMEEQVEAQGWGLEGDFDPEY